MWIEDKDGNIYNLDFAQAVILRIHGSQDKSYRVEAVLRADSKTERSVFTGSSNIVLLSTDNEEKARGFMAEVKAKLGVA